MQCRGHAGEIGAYQNRSRQKTLEHAWVVLKKITTADIYLLFDVGF